MRDPTRFLLVLLALISVLGSQPVPDRHAAERPTATLAQTLCRASWIVADALCQSVSAAPAVLGTDLQIPAGTSVIRHRSRGPPWV